MKPIAFGLFLIGLGTFAVSMFLPVNSDWLGLFWLAFAAEVVLRGPQGAADYPLFLLVCSGNLLVMLAAFAFAGAASWGRLAAHLLVLAAIGAIVACVRYHPATWALGFHAWIASLVILAAAIYMEAASSAAPATPDPRRQLTRALGTIRRSRDP